VCYSFDGASTMTHESTQSFPLRWTRLAAGILALVALATGPAGAQTSEGLRVVPLVKDDQVQVSFTLNDGFTEEVRAAIQSGLKTTFTYAAELRLDVPGWVDRTMAPLFSTSVLEANREYYVTVRATARPSNGSILWPFSSGTSAQAKFTFIK
jgi:hypothetical protein